MGTETFERAHDRWMAGENDFDGNVMGHYASEMNMDEPFESAAVMDASNPKRMDAFMFSVGDRVVKVKGYLWPGIVIMRGHTKAGHARYVVECTVPEVAGALHIYSATDLAHAENHSG